MFYGILIRMYLGLKEHNPPHFHAYYQEFKAVFSIATGELIDGELIDGELPPKQLKLVSAWAALHHDELIADWELAQNGELPYAIEPLK
jgi:hypothetical protein